jgi:hypothetical protein
MNPDRRTVIEYHGSWYPQEARPDDSRFHLPTRPLSPIALAIMHGALPRQTVNGLVTERAIGQQVITTRYTGSTE